ncbi:VOC family protein [Breznakiellaceae bacterium SP9]
MNIDAIGLFVNDMSKMVEFYRDTIGMKTHWNGEPNGDFEAGACRLIMFGHDDFEKMTCRKYGYPKGNNGTMEIAFTFEKYDDKER